MCRSADFHTDFGCLVKRRRLSSTGQLIGSLINLTKAPSNTLTKKSQQTIEYKKRKQNVTQLKNTNSSKARWDNNKKVTKSKIRYEEESQVLQTTSAEKYKVQNTFRCRVPFCIQTYSKSLFVERSALFPPSPPYYCFSPPSRIVNFK